jgi:hypothetical protein
MSAPPIIRKIYGSGQRGVKSPEKSGAKQLLNRTVRLIVIAEFVPANGDSQKYCSYSTDEFFKVWRHDLMCRCSE